MCLCWKLVEGEADLALHGLRCKVARLHVPLEQQQLVGYLPRKHLPHREGRRGGSQWVVTGLGASICFC